jgi:tRNA G10  N-methylase Trm11
MIYFILGAHPELSIAEIKAVLGPDYRPVFESRQVVLIEPGDQNLSELQDRLAGIIKVGRLVGELEDWDQQAAADLIASLASTAAGKNKISFGLSVYDVGDQQKTRLLEKELDRLGLEIKKRLKETGRPVRYVKGKEPRLSSAILTTNGLLESGGEFILLITDSTVHIGQTEATQNFKAWSDRDYGRPARDAKSGMLPPKLARMMVNLGGIDPHGATLLDPFCGSGTVLMEATLMGFGEMIGSDISEKAVADTATNMTWLVDRFDLVPPHMSLHTCPSVDLPTFHSSPVDLIVTEVFLGNPRSKTVDDQEAKRLEQELLPVFESSFTSLATLMKPSSRAVVAFPAFKKTRLNTNAEQEDDAWHRLDLTSLLERIGYEILENHLYFRENQFVARDIYVISNL